MTDASAGPMPAPDPATSYDALIGLGSNIGDKAANIARAIEVLTGDGAVRLVSASRIYRTAPWGVTDQDWFANAAIAVATSLSPQDLLARCLGVEQTMKRVREERWGPRIIDVDVLTYRDSVLAEPDLIVPHPRITERAFVLVPLTEIAPGLVIGGRPIEAWLAELGASDAVPL